jgi:hypothetical protein
MSAPASLTEAAITFVPSASKPAETAVSVYVSTRILTTINVLFAHRQRFAEADAWVDAERYRYPLETTPIVLGELAGDIAVRVEWQPAIDAEGCTLAYDLDLAFSNGAVLNHHVDGVSLDAQNRHWSSAIPLAEARSLR